MNKGNVLVIGNSGVGKSTLINAVLGENVAKTSFGPKGTTKEIFIYEGEPFNVIDTIGFEPSLFRNNKAIASVKSWSKKSAKEENEDKQINVIWFCVDGTSSKLFPKAIKDLDKATSMWKSVPIIVVITKSYSVPDRDKNIELVQSVFLKNKKLNSKLKHIIPVVASTYVLNDAASAPPEGITELIDYTNSVMPEGLKAAQKDIAKFNLNRKRALAQGIILTTVGTAVAKCIIKVGPPTSSVLATVENVMVDSLAKLYKVNLNSPTALFIKNNIANGTVNKIAKVAIEAVQKLPVGQKLGSAVINPLIAACVVIIIGESTSIAFEKIYLGEEDSTIVNNVKEFFESDAATQIVEQANSIASALNDKSSPKEISQATTDWYVNRWNKKHID